MAGIGNAMSWWLVALAIPVLFIAELVYFKIADRFDIIDKPNERSSHKSITLRGGGIIFYIAIVYFAMLFGFPYPWFLLGLTLITFISFIDDVIDKLIVVNSEEYYVQMALAWALAEIYISYPEKIEELLYNKILFSFCIRIFSCRHLDSLKLV